MFENGMAGATQYKIKKVRGQVDGCSNRFTQRRKEITHRILARYAQTSGCIKFIVRRFKSKFSLSRL